MKKTMTNTIKNLIGKKVTVKKGAGDYKNCTSNNAAYLIITSKDRYGFQWDTYDKKGKKIDYCFGHLLTEDDFLLYKRTLDDVEWKDLLKDNDGYYSRVLGREGDIVHVSYRWQNGEKEDTKYFCTFSIQDLKDYGYTFADEETEETVDTIEINSKKYNKADINECLKELKPLE